MRTGIAASFLRTAAVVGLFMTAPAGAVIITNQGIDTVTRHFVIDGAVSTVTHDPGLSFFGDIPPVKSYAVSGEFDVSFFRYWWSYFGDGDSTGLQGSFTSVQNWLTFSNAHVVGSPDGFQFPGYFISVNAITLSGSDDGCNFPTDPNTSCSGWTMGQIASLIGKFENGVMQLQGSMPISGGNLFEEFTFDIQTNTVPEPAVLTLFLSALGGLLVSRLKKQRR